MNLQERVDALSDLLGVDVKALRTSIGSLAALKTNAKASLVAAINDAIGSDGPMGNWPAGWFGFPSHLMSMGAVAPTANNATFAPHIVGPLSQTIDALVVQQNVAGAGTGLRMQLGLWPQQPNGLPDFASLIFSGDVPTIASATGNKLVQPPSLLALPRGRYLSGSLYTVTSQTTAPTFLANGNSLAMPTPAFTSSLGANRSLLISGSRTAFPTDNSGLTWTQDPNNTRPVVALRGA